MVREVRLARHRRAAWLHGGDTASPPTTHLRVSGASPGVVLGSTCSSPPLSFEFPSEWTAMSFEGLFTPFASPLVFVSNQLMEDPCNRESVCRPWPASVLEPGGFVLKWSSN